MKFLMGFVLGSVFCCTATVFAFDEVEWTDPVTGLDWAYVSPGKPWQQALNRCGNRGGNNAAQQEEGKGLWRLAEMYEIQVAHKRLWVSPVGEAAKLSHCLTWSNTPAPDVIPKHWAVYMNTGNAGAVGDYNPLPVLCVHGVSP